MWWLWSWWQWWSELQLQWQRSRHGALCDDKKNCKNQNDQPEWDCIDDQNEKPRHGVQWLENGENDPPACSI